MKKFLMSAIVFALCSIGAANAQLEKGSVLVGGGIGRAEGSTVVDCTASPFTILRQGRGVIDL